MIRVGCMMNRFAIVISILLMFAACGGTMSDDEQGRPNTVVQTSPQAVRLASAHKLPSAVYNHGIGVGTLSVNAVLGATSLSGSGVVIASGTLTQSGQSWQYDPQPSDHLIVVGADGQRAELYVTQMQGNLRSAADFFGENHRMTVRAVSSGGGDVTFTSTRLDGNREVTAQGSVLVDHVAFAVDLAFRGFESSESDRMGSSHNSRYTISGTATGSDVVLTVNESWRFELVATTERTASGSSASADARTVNNVVVLGSDRFEWKDVVTQKSYREGKPSSVHDYWMARGEVLRNGDVFGRYRKDGLVADRDKGGGFIKFVLALTDGTVIEMESWQAY